MYTTIVDGKTTVILNSHESITIELPGGNGETFTIDADTKTVKDEDGIDLTSAYWN